MLLLLLLLISYASIHCMEENNDIPLREVKSLQNLDNFIPTADITLDHENELQTVPAPLTIHNVWSTWAHLESTKKFNEYPEFKKQAYEVIVDDILSEAHREAIFDSFYYEWSHPKHTAEKCPLFPTDRYDSHVKYSLSDYIRSKSPVSLDAKREILEALTQHARIQKQIELKNRAVCCTTGTCLCGVVELFCILGCCLSGCP